MSVKNPKYEYKNLTCLGCGCLFDSKTRNKKQKYCTQSCRGIHLDAGVRFKKGEPSWNKDTSKSGMSGKSHSQETKDKMRESSLGEKAGNWKGGVSSMNDRIRNSGRYKAWRTSVFERDNYTCVHCSDKSIAGNRVVLNADHIKPFAFYPELRFDIDNGRTLCEPCHRKTDTWGAHKDMTITGKKATHIESGKSYEELKQEREA